MYFIVANAYVEPVVEIGQNKKEKEVLSIKIVSCIYICILPLIHNHMRIIAPMQLVITGTAVL